MFRSLPNYKSIFFRFGKAKSPAEYHELGLSTAKIGMAKWRLAKISPISNLNLNPLLVIPKRGFHVSPVSSQSDLEKFFGKYPEFDYKPGRNAAREFQRLAGEKGWSQAQMELKEMKKKKGGGEQPKKKMSPEEKRLTALESEYGDAKTKFYRAFQKEFNAVFDIGYLCEVLGLEIPETGLKKMLRTVHVNIYELHHYEKALRKGRTAKIVDMDRALMRQSKSMALLSGSGTDINIETSGDIIMFRFKKVEDLADYTHENGLIYSKMLAKEEGALKHMLRHVGLGRGFRSIERKNSTDSLTLRRITVGS
ncbi:hypothetical protein FPQ18DRAFT_321172 [Pyronema domesticum]|uniref:Uncharacterized protein n=1 Tax=Pyronema omphalodes (strain CBS 100304) TaxID=1076935 RepID=U4L9S4_PYROM|nr:hypothetical protein FPQ18DRAFT_321172 [Pyronema domesticum]CCX15445.1 Protein of unknown function [Pyronema omphalodes CBS 100304]